jgi:cell division protein FtsL
LEEEPTVTEYISPAANALFTTEKFERMTVEEPVRQAAPTPVAAAVVSTQAQYSLSPLAKVVMAVFTFVIVAMLTMICVNTHLLSQKRIKIQNLEEKKEQLMQQYDDIQRRIEAAQSEEAIRDYALSQGMVQAGN